jgi:hypothetical protein
MSVKTKTASATKDKGSATGASGGGAAQPVAFTPMEYDAFLAKLGTKDRLNVERHVAACDAEEQPTHSNNYRQLVCALAGMAPHAAKTHGQQAVQLYVPDGKYRMQVFAIQDQRDGIIVLYTDDVLDVALKAGLLNGPYEVAEQNNSYRLPNSVDSIKVDQLDGKTANPSPFYKDMLGWNRRAIRITLPATATAAQVKAAETLCAIGAKKWYGKVEAAAAK